MAKPKEAEFIATRLRELRHAAALTQEKFAERAGLSYKVYQSFESGRLWNLEMKTVIKLAAEHGLTLTEFFSHHKFGKRKPRRDRLAPAGLAK